jgi:serine/threonine protein kinase
MIPTEKMRICLGQHLGNYQIRQQLGRGGFAEVYLGEHIYLGTHAALKVLTGPLDEHEAILFQREARLLASLIHPHIVRVLEFDIENATPYLVLDYAPGGTLRKRHPRGKQLPLATVVDYVTQIAAALQCAHNQHLIHCDVKPENILLGRDGELLLADFGIAVLTQSIRSAHTQQIVGTVTYMAPEQLQGHPCKASDQYALAILAYEWLCGHPPFSGPPNAVAAQHCFVSPLPLRDQVLSLPSRVEQVILRALAKDPAARFPSVKAFADVLSVASLAFASEKNRASTHSIESSPSALCPDHPLLSETQPARPGVAAPSFAKKGNSHDARTPLTPTVHHHRLWGTSSLPAFNAAPAKWPVNSHSMLWALVCGGGIGYSSCGFLLLLYMMATAYGATNAIVLLAGGVLLLPSLGCLYLAGWLTRKRTGRVTPAWVAGSLAGLIQPASAGVLGHAIHSVVLPASFPLFLLLWVMLGGLLGLLKVRRRRH